MTTTRTRRLRPRGFALAGLLALLVAVAPSLVDRATVGLRRLDVVHDAGVVTPAPGDRSTRGLRVAAFNIAHGRGRATSNWGGGSPGERRARLDALAETLRSIDADVVVLNEVDVDAAWSDGVDQAAHLARYAGYPYRAVVLNFDVRVLAWTFRFGNAILSRHPLRDVAVIDLPGYAWYETLLTGEKRAIRATVDVPGGPVTVVGVHLSPTAEGLRVRSADRLVAAIAALDGAVGPVVVAGDLNATLPGAPCHERTAGGRSTLSVLLEDGALRVAAPAHGEPTFPSGAPDRTLDWILVEEGVRVTDARVHPTEHADHDAVSAVLRPATAAP